MESFLTKLSSYNLFNYLLPGIIFVILLDTLTDYSLIQSDLILGAFMYYFIGLVISRIGSIIVERILIKIGFLKFSPYADYVAASKMDESIELLSEANNTYRTLSAMFLLLLILMVYEKAEKLLLIPRTASVVALLGILVFLFLYSYRKQTTYITKRIEATK